MPSCKIGLAAAVILTGLPVHAGAQSTSHGVPADFCHDAIVENGWDFNGPEGVPGFGPMRATDDPQKMIAGLFSVSGKTDGSDIITGSVRATRFSLYRWLRGMFDLR